jgi:hypothetical protein
LVVLHDIYPEQCGWDGPRYVLDHIAEDSAERAKWQVLELPTPSIDNYGLAVLKRIEPSPSKILPRLALWFYRWKVYLRSWLRRKP